MRFTLLFALVAGIIAVFSVSQSEARPDISLASPREYVKLSCMVARQKVMKEQNNGAELSAESLAQIRQECEKLAEAVPSSQ